MERKPGLEPSPDEITKPAVTDSIPALVAFVTSHARETGFREDRVHQIGRATTEALQNIVKFACPDGRGEIRISCTTHDSGSLIVNIIDSGKPLNVLLADTFRETQDFFDRDKAPSTRVMKKVIKNIEYRRGTEMNTLVFTISPEVLG